MRPGPAGRDQLIADATRERKVSDPVAMQMPELAPAEAKLDSAKPMRPDLHVRPRAHRGGDPLTCTNYLVIHRLAPASTSASA
jgi:hypothetical protein